MSISVREVLTHGIARLQAAGIESARLDARVLLSEALGTSSDSLYPAEISAGQIARFDESISRRAAREPLAYITGRKEFWSLEFNVGPGVLIPRPETETLIEAASHHFPGVEAQLRVLDIGTGSGCLIVALLKARPNAIGVGIDNSQAALAFARRNANNHGLSPRCEFAETIATEREFDVVLANPPYLRDEELAVSQAEIRDFEPHEAFAAGPDGLAGFRIFLTLAAKSLAADGMAFFEIGAGQEIEVTEIVTQVGLEVRRIIHDLSGVPRCLAIGRGG